MNEAAPERTHAEIEELLGAYALDALEPSEASEVDRHLRTCVRCAVEVSNHHAVAGLLANSGGDAPDALWDRIADQLETPRAPGWERLAARLDPPGLILTDLAGPGDSLDVQGAGRERSKGNAADSPSGHRSSVVVPLEGRRRGRIMTRAVSVVAAAAAVLAIVLGVQVNHLNHQVTAMQIETSRPSVATAAQAALEDPATQRVHLAPLATTTGADASASVTVVIEPSGTGYLIAKGLNRLASGQTYQLWGSFGGQLISLGLLGPKPVVVAFSIDGSIPVHAFAITAENGGGVVQSTHIPVVEGQVTA